jgi:hypothetical protein
VLASGQPGETEARLQRFDAKISLVLLRGVPLYDESGGLVKWYSTNTDIEDRRASEHLARDQLEALKHMLSSLAQNQRLRPLFPIPSEALHRRQKFT